MLSIPLWNSGLSLSLASLAQYSLAEDGCISVYAYVLTVDHLCRLGSTKGKELRASKDKVFSDPETKVMNE